MHTTGIVWLIAGLSIGIALGMLLPGTKHHCTGCQEDIADTWFRCRTESFDDYYPPEIRSEE